MLRVSPCTSMIVMRENFRNTVSKLLDSGVTDIASDEIYLTGE